MSVIRAYAPGSIANLGCGFDVFGLALESPGDEVEAALRDGPGVVIEEIEGDGGRLPREADSNTAGVAVRALLAHLGRKDVGIALRVRKGLPLGSGLGSSGASGVAAVVAANELLGTPLEREALLPFTIEAERAACGAAHADNVAASLLGGFVIVRSHAPPDVIRLPTPPDLWCALVRPHLEVRTGEARRLLPDQVPLETAVRQWANTASLVAGMLTEDYGLIGRAVEDLVAEPGRSRNVPGFASVRAAALEAGALGAGLSGSGPTLFALCRGAGSARNVADAMRAAFAGHDLKCDVHLSRPNPDGAVLRSNDATS